MQYFDIFVEHDRESGHTDLTIHKIDTEVAKLIEFPQDNYQYISDTLLGAKEVYVTKGISKTL